MLTQNRINPDRWNGRYFLGFLGCCIVALICGGCLTGTQEKVAGTQEKEYHYWDLGVGSYGSMYGKTDNMTFLDMARLDWIYVIFGNERAARETTERLNSFLKVNPKQKYVIQLWPVYSYKAPGQKDAHLTSFMDYLYDPEVKRRILNTLKMQVRVIEDYISDPSAVYGYTLPEEMPCNFSDNGQFATKPLPIPRDMEYYRKHYEEETGRKLTVWDADAKKWWGKKYAQVINELHAYVKKVSGNRRVFTYFMAHVRTLDFLKEGESIMSYGVMPFYMSDLIGPDKSDGVFAFPATPGYLKDWADLTAKLHIPYFTQFSASGDMRLLSWEDTLKIEKHKVRENLGYFFYLYDDGLGTWNDHPYGQNDPMIVYNYAKKLRQHCAAENVGMDIVRANLKPEIRVVDFDLKSVPVNSFGQVWCVVRNPADASWFKNPEEGVMKDVRVSLKLPPEFELPEGNNPLPLEIHLKKVDGGKDVIISWWARRIAPTLDPEKSEVVFTISSDRFPPREEKYTGLVRHVEPEKDYSIRSSGDICEYVNYKLPFSRKEAVFTIRCTEGACSNPSLAVGMDRITWNGMLKPGDKLVLGPGMKAEVFRKGKDSGLDVSGNLIGLPVRIRKGINRIAYYDQDAPRSRVKARLSVTPLK